MRRLKSSATSAEWESGVSLTKVPVVDVAEVLHERTLRELAAACSDWGCFQIINSEIHHWTAPDIAAFHFGAHQDQVLVTDLDSIHAVFGIAKFQGKAQS